MPAAAATSAEDSPAKLGRRSTELLQRHDDKGCETNGEWKPEAEAFLFSTHVNQFFGRIPDPRSSQGLHNKSF